MPYFIKYTVPSALTRLLTIASKDNSYIQNNVCFGYVDTCKLKESGQFYYTV